MDVVQYPIFVVNDPDYTNNSKVGNDDTAWCNVW